MNIKEYFDELNEREQKLVVLAGICLGFFLLYALIYSPIISAVTRKQKLLIENKQTLQWMEEVYSKQKNINSSEVLSNEKLLTVLTSALKNSNLKDFTYQLEQTTTGDVRLSFAKAPYNTLLNWLWSFCGKYSLTVKTFTATPKGDSGIVDVVIVLSQN